MLNSFLADFDLDELSSSDVEDVVSLAVNRVLENRLLAITASDPNLLMDAAATIEKFRKQSNQIKQNLANRRVDRIDLKTKPALSIVDLAAHLDEQKKLDFKKRVEALEQADADFVPPERDAEGDRHALCAEDTLGQARPD